MPSVSEIARHAGVSKSTVSLALNNKPGVSEQMRQVVLNAANELRALEEAASVKGVSTGPDHLSRSDGKQPLSAVVLHPSILRSSQVFTELLQGIQAGANLYQLQLRLAVNEPQVPDDHITRLYLSDPTLRPDGILVIGARLDEPLIREARKLGIPCVLVGRRAPEPGISAAGRDEVASAFEATTYLLGLGHRAVAFIGGDKAYSYTHSRLLGYRRAFQEQGLPLSESWISLGDGRPAAEAILANSPDITAAIFLNDAYAMEALPVFQAAGRLIPDDLSVISFDDTDEARCFRPPLTSVAYPRYQEGLWAVKALVELIRHSLMKSSQIVFHASLIKRDSCTPPRRVN